MRFSVAVSIAALAALSACDTASTAAAPAASATMAPAGLDSLVRANFSALMGDIAVGGGATLNAALDVAGVASGHRIAVASALNDQIDDYSGNPDALIAALAAYSS